MKALFLDPNKPLSTCSSMNCQVCVVNSRLHCHFNDWDLLRFFSIAFPPFIIAGIGIVRVKTWLLLPWLALVLVYFGFIEIRVMCSHCPHYAEPVTKSLQCWANYGAPKLWKYRPGPMSASEKVVFFISLGLIAGYPLVLLLLNAAWLFFVLLSFAVIAMSTLMSSLMCKNCMNFACPFSRIEIEVREAVFNHNPTIAKAWKGDPS
jgi:hypothetical protein